MALTNTPVTSDSGAATGTTTMSLTTTHSFSPGAGSMVLVSLSWLFNSGGAPTTITVQDSHGNSYTSQLQAANSFNVAGSAFFYFVYSSAPGATTLTVTSSASSTASGGTEFLISPTIITGQASGTIFGPNTINIAPGGSTTSLTASLTTTAAGSQVYLAGGIESGSTLTPVSGTTTTATYTGYNNAVTGLGTTQTGTPGATTFGFTASPAAAFGGNLLGVEVLPATGTTITSTGSASMTPVKAAGSGASAITSAGSASLAAALASGTGSMTSGVVANGSASLGAVKAAGTGATPIIATGSASLGVMKAAGTAAEVIASTGSAPLTPVRAAGTGAEAIPATGSAALSAMKAAGTAGETIASTGSARMAVMGAGGTVAVPVIAAGGASLGAMTARGNSGSGTITVAGTWTGVFAVGNGFFFPPPSSRPVQVPVTNTAGDWLFAVTAWRPSTTGSDVSVCVADDAHNWWEPVGAPVTDSDEDGVVRVSVWAAPAARVANTDTGVTNVQVAATGPVLSMATVIADVNGLLPWYQVAAIATATGSAGTSLGVSVPAPASRALLFAGFASDDNSKTITGPAGWTALPAASDGNGVDHTTDIKLTAAYQVTTSAATASVSSSGSLDLAGVIAGVIISAPQPAQPNPAWPVMTTEVAIGAGIGTPPSEMTWTPLSGRSLGLGVTQGKQYTLGQLQAAQGTLTLDDPDGALIPPGTGAYAGIDSGTPVRRRVTWPGLGGSPSLSPHYVAFSGYVRRWPFNADANFLRGQVQADLTDAWGYGNGPLNAMAIEECLLDSPHSLWPLTDPPGSTGSGNLVPNGPGLQQAVSKYGAGGATVTWGANSGAIIGLSSAQVTSSGKAGGASGMFQQKLAGNSLSTVGYGYALTASATDFPAVTGGVTIEAVAQIGVGSGGISFTAPAGTTISVSTSLATGQAVIPTVASGFTFPTGLTAGQIYFVVGQGGTSVQLATTPGGSPVTITATGFGFMQPTLSWNPVILAARALGAPVAGLEADKFTGHLLLRYRPANSTADTTVTVDTTWDYRNGGLWHYSLSFTRTTWRVLIDGGGLVTASGTFSSPVAATFTDVCYAGVMDRTSQGLNWPGNLGGPAGVYPGVSQQVRVISRYWAILAGMGGEAADARVERLLEYGGLAGRRWIGQPVAADENDTVASGQDVGGQAAVSGVNNIVASTAPALAYVAPTGDVVYHAKGYTWNQPVRWTLGGNTAAGEIPFKPGQLATDYDPSRVTAQVQLTQLDSQAVTAPNGVMAATTMAAVAKAAGGQYGGQPYQQTGYLQWDWSAAYNAGSSLVDLSNWVQAVFAKPANRIQSVTVNAAAYPAAWPFWAGASVGDMVRVNLTLPTAGTSPLISLVARITQTARASQYTSDSPPSATITATLDFAPEYNALTCDDPVRGLLDGATNVMPW